MAQNCIPKDINDALATAFESDVDTLSRILVFLAVELANQRADPFINTLNSVLGNPTLFQKVAERMAEDTKTAEKDQQYKQFMQDVWTNYLKDDLAENSSGNQQMALAVSDTAIAAVAQHVFMRCVYQLPAANFTALQSAVRAIAAPGALVRSADRVLTTARSAGPAVQVALVAAFLAYDIIKNIRRWWKGEITGKRCAKNIIDNGVSIAAGIAGGVGGEMLGATVGIAFGPAGMAVGAISGALIGSMVSATGAEVLSDRLTQWIFGLPKSEALENAYAFLGLAPTVSNTEINSRYRQLARQYHPDKHGDPEKWTRLQYSLAVIREARGAY